MIGREHSSRRGVTVTSTAATTTLITVSNSVSTVWKTVTSMVERPCARVTDTSTSTYQGV